MKNILKIFINLLSLENIACIKSILAHFIADASDVAVGLIAVMVMLVFQIVSSTKYQMIMDVTYICECSVHKNVFFLSPSV